MSTYFIYNKNNKRFYCELYKSVRDTIKSTQLCYRVGFEEYRDGSPWCIVRFSSYESAFQALCWYYEVKPKGSKAPKEFYILEENGERCLMQVNKRTGAKRLSSIQIMEDQ